MSRVPEEVAWITASISYGFVGLILALAFGSDPINSGIALVIAAIPGLAAVFIAIGEP